MNKGNIFNNHKWMFLSILIFIFALLASENKFVNAATETIVSDTTTKYRPSESSSAVLMYDSVVSWVHEGWPSITGATWIWSTDRVDSEDEFGPYWFKKTFTLPSNAIGITGTIQITADNAYELYLNGALIGSDGTVRSPPIDHADDSEHVQRWSGIETYPVTPLAGNNYIEVKANNYGGWVDPDTNPAGIIFRLDVSYSTFSCTGTTPSDATLCNGDDSGLTADTSKTLVSSCTSGTKCEYTCNAGYVKSGSSCVAVVVEEPYVELTAAPTDDTSLPIRVDLTATMHNTPHDQRFYYYFDCNDDGIEDTSYGSTSSTSHTVGCNYNIGTYTAKVRVTRSNPTGSDLTDTYSPITIAEADITANDAQSVSIDYGTTESVNVEWCGTDAHACINADSCKVGTTDGGSEISTQKSGQYTTPALTADTSYYLTCASSFGSTTKDRVLIDVCDSSKGSSCNCNPCGCGGVITCGGSCSEAAPECTAIDIGLRISDGSSVVTIAAEPGTPTSPLRISKDGTIYGIALVELTDPEASKSLINTSSGIKALRKFGSIDVCTDTSPSSPVLLSPINGATSQSTAPTLDWSDVLWGTNCNGNSNSYVLYLKARNKRFRGSDAIRRLTGSSYMARNLDEGTTYYWKVVATNGARRAQSPVYGFSTVSCTPTETAESSCSDGIDNDCDGLKDCADTNCDSAAACVTCTPSCSGRACDEFNSCGTALCGCPSGQTCSGGSCVATCTPTSGQSSTETSCSDGVDNDCDGDFDCEDANCASATSCITIPSAPSSLSGTPVCAATSDADINLVWNDNSNNEDGFYVYRSTSSGFTPSSSNRIATKSAGSESHTDTSPSLSTTYYYKITAYNTAGESSAASSSGVTTGSCPPTCTPTQTSETSCSDGVDNDCDGETDCVDTNCAGRAGPGSVTCCQTVSDCPNDDCKIESCSSNTCSNTNRAQGATDECGTCQSCSSAGGNCAGITANTGKSCDDDCTYCSSGSCTSRAQGATDECGTVSGIQQYCTTSGGNCGCTASYTCPGCGSAAGCPITDANKIVPECFSNGDTDANAQINRFCSNADGEVPGYTTSYLTSCSKYSQCTQDNGCGSVAGYGYAGGVGGNCPCPDLSGTPPGTPPAHYCNKQGTDGVCNTVDDVYVGFGQCTWSCTDGVGPKGSPGCPSGSSPGYCYCRGLDS